MRKPWGVGLWPTSFLAIKRKGVGHRPTPHGGKLRLQRGFLVAHRGDADAAHVGQLAESAFDRGADGGGGAGSAHVGEALAEIHRQDSVAKIDGSNLAPLRERVVEITSRWSGDQRLNQQTRPRR